jgi:hypothetical protein
MKKISLSTSVLVKDNDKSALAIDVMKDEFFHFEGDVAKLLVILSEKKSIKDEQVSVKTLQDELVRRSKSFAKNRWKKQCILEALNYFRNHGLLG